MTTNADSKTAPESAERVTARDRGQTGAEQPEPKRGESAGGVLAHHAFVALADNVRDYAVFLMEASGVICYWGEGARLMKWWRKAEAEGGHLRMLYPDRGSEDGTADEHLAHATATGEYVGEGQRVRRDGSTFWAGVTLTALRNATGELLGFAKVTRDLTVRRAAEAALAMAWSAQGARQRAQDEASTARIERDIAREDAAFALEQVRSAREYASRLLERQVYELAVERTDLMSEMAALNAQVLRLTRMRDELPKKNEP